MPHQKLRFLHAAEASLARYPSALPHPGLLVGWSMETQHRRQPPGFSFGDPQTTPDQGYIDPILMEDEGHLITIAPTGAGKGVGCIVPALLRHEGPVFVVDPKGENTAITARGRRERGETVAVIDPMGLTSEVPASLNPLDLIDPKSANGVDEALALINALLPDNTADHKNSFWVGRARQLLLAVVLHVVTDLEPQERTLMKVREIVHEMTNNPGPISKRLAKSRHPEVRLIEGTLGINAKETLGGILAFAQEGIDFVRGPQLQQSLGSTSFDLDEIVRGGPVSIYLVLPPHMLGSHGRVLRLWISALFQLIQRRRSRPKKSTLFILDEAAQLGTLSELRTAITLLRGYGLQTWSFWQDVSQLKILYPLDWQTMVNNSRVLQAFGANNMSAARDMSNLMGFVSAEQVLDLRQGEMLLQIAGDEAVAARLPNYRSDPVFEGQFDQNPFFNSSIDPLPEKDLSREYLRSEKVVVTKERHGKLRRKANPVDGDLAKRILDSLESG
ncbi:hypothetical protein C1J03_15685 [Sulfitobacter sp. SK012]|uniref:type IV secretory system conjugative DNA transfer family protein n=1 Tax=Sulfitobacter sp. SK012 TaxID=1389005 RepID=UPI000E0B21B5|nr:type IV secretory system conjugative DNA transfer family protein [Sulfitobacter sp. SK012]AXI47324.1 hypothetical protein C1J03_15685 [Sulfitobacter sp. SK012]